MHDVRLPRESQPRLVDGQRLVLAINMLKYSPADQVSMLSFCFDLIQLRLACLIQDHDLHSLLFVV